MAVDTAREEKAMRSMTERLVGDFSEVHSAEQVETVVGAVRSRFEGHAVREFVPILVERIARRELNYRPPGERIVAYDPAELAAFRPVLPEASGDRVQPVADPRPGWMVSVCEWLPAWPWRKLFAESPNRLLMLTMAGGLFVTAFVLYCPAPPARLARRCRSRG